eukprot:15476129-Alexandrium_andersonii.AAC.1
MAFPEPRSKRNPTPVAGISGGREPGFQFGSVRPVSISVVRNDARARTRSFQFAFATLRRAD